MALQSPEDYMMALLKEYELKNGNMTAVEWLIEEVIKKHPIITQFFDKEIIEQAKQTEKKQIIRAYNQDLYGGLSGDKKFDDGEQYYNETYGK